MPWISEERCVGCGICEQKCPAGAISMHDGSAVLDMNSCIRCGICHDVCPRSAIRHDSELIAWEIRANLERAEWSMSECERLPGSADQRSRCLERLLKHFNKEKRVIEETLRELEQMKLV